MHLQKNKNDVSFAKPLTRSTEEGCKFKCEDCQRAFDQLKGSLLTALTLSYPLPNGKYILGMDASNDGISSVLSQMHGSQEMVISFFCKTLSNPERNYCHQKGIVNHRKVRGALLEVLSMEGNSR